MIGFEDFGGSRHALVSLAYLYIGVLSMLKEKLKQKDTKLS
jgi:hypothetical protein